MPGPVNQAAYVDLEVSLMDAFSKAWEAYYKPFGVKIQKAIKQKDFSTAHDLIESLSMAVPLSRVMKKAETLGNAVLLLGAKNVHKNVKKTRVYENPPEQYVQNMLNQMEIMLGRNFTLLLKKNAHDEVEWVKRVTLELGNPDTIVKAASFLEHEGIVIPSREQQISVTSGVQAIASQVGMSVVTGLDTRVTIQSGGKSYMSMSASLHTNRMRSLGFLIEAYQRDIAKYAIKAHLDDKTSDTCKELDGKKFEVELGLQKIVQAAETDDPDALKSIAPWPKAKDVKGLSEEDLIARGVAVPPFHPFCRTVIVLVEQSSTIEGTTVTQQGPVYTDEQTAQMMGPMTDKANREITRIIDDLPYDAKTFKLSPEYVNTVKSLSNGEINAVYRYTQGGYKDLNTKLLKGAKMTPKQRGHSEILSSVLNRLPKHEGAVYRGEAFYKDQQSTFEKLLESYTPGSVVEKKAYVSTTRNQFKMFGSSNTSSPYQSSNQIDYVIRSKTGRDVSVMSAHRHEDEVLFDKGTKFKVVDVQVSENQTLHYGTWKNVVVYMDEI